MDSIRGRLHDIAEHYYSLAEKETDADNKKSRIAVAEYYLKKDADNYDYARRVERSMSDFAIARIEPWDSSLDPDLITQDVDNIDDILAKDMLLDLERRGISHIRITAQSAEDYVIRSLAKLIGPLTASQNDFQGDVQLITPKAGGAANSGNTLADLGLHVDGTQHSETPAILIFHYISGAKVGANSIFVDMAKVLADIDETRRFELLINLSRPDAAIFFKKNMRYEGPIFYFSPTGSLVCRTRFDDVITVHPDCRSDYEFLKQQLNDPSYSLEFKPRQGDIVVFDNWRILHARDEVYGLPVRQHWRAWVSNLKPVLQPKYYLGLRPFPTDIAARIERTNRGQ